MQYKPAVIFNVLSANFQSVFFKHALKKKNDCPQKTTVPLFLLFHPITNLFIIELLFFYYKISLWFDSKPLRTHLLLICCSPPADVESSRLIVHYDFPIMHPDNLIT